MSALSSAVYRAVNVFEEVYSGQLNFACAGIDLHCSSQAGGQHAVHTIIRGPTYASVAGCPLNAPFYTSVSTSEYT